MRSREGGGPIGEWARPWLIQRLNKPFKFPEGHLTKGRDNPFSFGGGLPNGGLSKEAMACLRSVFTFDYMGSSEFEWGAVPKALCSMVVSIQDLTAKSFEVDQGDVSFGKWEERYFKKPVKGVTKTVYVIAKDSHQVPAENYIRSLIGKEPELKERTRFHEALLEPSDSAEDWRTKTQGWLDLDNCLLFFTDKEMFEKMKVLLEAPKEVKQ